MIIFSKYIFFSSFNALAIWPFIFLKDRSLKSDNILLNHEKIHLRQQIEMLWLVFFIIYLFEFLIKLMVYKKPKLAYFNLSFEREAYQNEENLNYLRNRKLWSVLKYF